VLVQAGGQPAGGVGGGAPLPLDFHPLLPASHDERRACAAVWGHAEGCQFCSQLFGHYLLPNGQLAHFYLPPGGGRGSRGPRAVAAAPPSPAPWAAAGDAEPDAGKAASCAAAATAAAAAAAAALRRLLSRAAALAAFRAGAGGRLNWVPVPPLAPLPTGSVLRGERSRGGAGAPPLLRLDPGPVRLRGVVRETMRTEEVLLPELPPPAAAARRRTTAEARGKRGKRGAARRRARRRAAGAARRRPAAACCGNSGG
jgi:hypothetical protein